MNDAPRSLTEIAAEITRDWVKPSPHALPYLKAMGSLSNTRDRFREDSAKSIILYFLSNAHSWKGGGRTAHQERAERDRAGLKIAKST